MRSMAALMGGKEIRGARQMARTAEGRAMVADTLELHRTMWGMLNRILALIPASADDIENKRTLELNMRALAAILSEVEA